MAWKLGRCSIHCHRLSWLHGCCIAHRRYNLSDRQKELKIDSYYFFSLVWLTLQALSIHIEESWRALNLSIWRWCWGSLLVNRLVNSEHDGNRRAALEPVVLFSEDTWETVRARLLRAFGDLLVETDEWPGAERTSTSRAHFVELVLVVELGNYSSADLEVSSEVTIVVVVIVSELLSHDSLHFRLSKCWWEHLSSINSWNRIWHSYWSHPWCWWSSWESLSHSWDIGYWSLRNLELIHILGWGSKSSIRIHNMDSSVNWSATIGVLLLWRVDTDVWSSGRAWRELHVTGWWEPVSGDVWDLAGWTVSLESVTEVSMSAADELGRLVRLEASVPSWAVASHRRAELTLIGRRVDVGDSTKTLWLGDSNSSSRRAAKMMLWVCWWHAAISLWTLVTSSWAGKWATSVLENWRSCWATNHIRVGATDGLSGGGELALVSWWASVVDEIALLEFVVDSSERSLSVGTHCSLVVMVVCGWSLIDSPVCWSVVVRAGWLIFLAANG